MKRFTTDHRGESMTVTISYRDVPMARGIAFVLYHVEKHGGRINVFSADRRDEIIRVHNRLFHTDLHSQKWLIAAHRKAPRQTPAANRIDRSSHCYYSDGNEAYKDRFGRQIPVGHELPWYMLGLDISDEGKIEDVSRFMRIAQQLGYKFVQPYQSGQERHHVTLVESPVKNLEDRNVISKKR